MGYMKEIAKLLGVEFGERFGLLDSWGDWVRNDNGDRIDNCYLNECGMIVDNSIRDDMFDGVFYLDDLLTGNYTITKQFDNTNDIY